MSIWQSEPSASSAFKMDKLFDAISSAASSLWAKKMRSLLSILGIVIGILTVSSLLTIAFGVRDQVSSYISDLGANLITVLPGDIDQGGFSSQLGASTLTEQDVESIRVRVTNAQNLNAAMVVSGTVKQGDVSLPSAFIFAASPGIDKTFNLKLETGRFLTPEEESSHARRVVVGAKAAQTLFPGSDALGKSLSIRSESYEVVGVMHEVSNASSFGGPDVNSMIIMPLSTGWEVTGTKQIFRISMQAPTPEDIDFMKKNVEAVILANHRGEKDFSVLSQDDLQKFSGDILNLITAMISALAGISLVVGGIGIMNIMLVTVSERTREIGIRKAIGATRLTIILQFLIESIMLTLLAGVIAVGMFSAIIVALKPRIAIPISLDPKVIGLALIFAIVSGVIFGIIPAIQASRKDPIDALRFE